jgi:hypothetical protein
MDDGPPDRLDVVITLLRQAVGRSAAPELLYQLSEALWMRGEHPEAADVFRQAFLADPDASPLVPEPGTDPYRLRDRSQSLLDQGVAFSPVIAARAIAAVMVGDVAGARRLIDYERFCRRLPVTPPPGFGGLDFNTALSAEIKADLTFYGDEENGAHLATRSSWRNNDVLKERSRTCMALGRIVRAEVVRYIAELPEDTTHPFLASRPSSFELKAWAIVSRGAGYLHAHLHPRAWLSAVYYVTQPAVSEEPGSRRGWLRLGLPEAYRLDPSGGWDELLIEPKRGTLFLMPAYFLHGTSPMGTDDERISIAFDIVPTDLAPAPPAADQRRVEPQR